MKYCSKCGSYASDNAKVCENCGARLTRNQTNMQSGNNADRAVIDNSQKSKATSWKIVSIILVALIILLLSLLAYMIVNDNTDKDDKITEPKENVKTSDSTEKTDVSENGIAGNDVSENKAPEKPVDKYTDEEYAAFVEEVLYAYVESINFDDVSILKKHLDGEALNTADEVHNAVSKSAAAESVISVNCYNVNRLSDTQVTVVRESTIRIVKYDGSVKDVSEKYLSTVEVREDGTMKVIRFENMDS